MRKNNWVRPSEEVVQLLNLQPYPWGDGDPYLNFAAWPAALGRPETLVESRFPIRARLQGIVEGGDLPRFFEEIDRLRTLDGMRQAYRAGAMSRFFVRVDARQLLVGS